MGIQISGPIAFDALQTFDGLWTGAHVCTNDDCTQETTITSISHDLSVLTPPIIGNDVVFSLFRDHYEKTADEAIGAAIGAANSEVNIVQNRFVDTVLGDTPQYVTGILNAIEKDGVYVNLLVSGGNGKVDGLVDLAANMHGVCNLYDQIKDQDALSLLRFKFRYSHFVNPIHTKALSLDDSFVIVGSQNFDPSAWGSNIYSFGDLAEYSLGIDSTAAANDFQANFTEEWDAASEIRCFSLQDLLQHAIDEVLPGTAIYIPAGVYTGSFTINKPLVLVGAGANQTIIRPDGNQPAFRITSSDVVIANMKIIGGSGYGIELIDSSPSSLKNIQINRIAFENNALGGVLAQGLIPGSPMNYSVENSTFIGGTDGITINMIGTQTEASFIRDNIFFGQTTAPVHILSANDSHVEYSYNLFDDCGVGACTTNWRLGNMNVSSSVHDNLFDLNPLFTNPEEGAYQLSASSPAIDAGDPSLFHDLFQDGNNDGFAYMDIGAFEYVYLPVTNAAPVVNTGNDQNVNLGGSVNIAATYTDVDNSEGHSARIDWGDGTVEDVAVNMTGPGAGEVIAEHTYVDSGNYTVEVCVTDLYGSVGCDTVNIVVNSGFPSTAVLDNFNRANGSIGSNWSGYTSKYHITSNQMTVDYNGSNSDIYWNNLFGADQEAYVTFTDIDSTASEQDLLLKAQSNTTWGDGVIEVLYDPTGQTVQVWTYEWPDGWVQHGADIPITFVDGDIFGARALANGTVEVYKNGTLLATRDITAWPHYADGGYIGLWFIGAEDAVLDDFGGGTISGSTAPMSMSSGSTESENLMPAQLNVNVQDAVIFWQGMPIGLNQPAEITFTNIPADKQSLLLKPQSNGVWGEGVVEILYDVASQRIQVWVYDAQAGNGWVQYGKDIPVKFIAGDQFSVQVLADGTVEIHRNGKLLAKRDVTP